MKILLDHCVPRRFRTLLVGHEVMSVSEMQWTKLRNGELLLAAAGRFDAMITVDQGVKHQQNLDTLPIGVIVLIAVSNRMADLERLAPRVEAALREFEPRKLIEVS